MKEEKIRIAMEKLAEASVAKVHTSSVLTTAPFELTHVSDTQDVIKFYIEVLSSSNEKGASTSRTLLVESIEVRAAYIT